MSNVSFLTIHGMGNRDTQYFSFLKNRLEERLKDQFNALHFDAIYYQDFLQDNEDRVWERTKDKVSLSRLRQFVLFGFGDAVGLENGKELPNSVYTRTQERIAAKLLAAYHATSGDRKLVMFAHSLGCQALSCYFWDANVGLAGGKYSNRHKTSVGVWRDVQALEQSINQGNPFTDDELDFLRGGKLKYLYTTGCNIPIFVGAHAVEDILPIVPNQDFKWHNFYDSQDILGWPLNPLYKKDHQVKDLQVEDLQVEDLQVEDHLINADSDFWGWILRSWNPFSHSEYWGDNDVLFHLAQNLSGMLPPAPPAPKIKNVMPDSPFFQD